MKYEMIGILPSIQRNFELSGNFELTVPGLYKIVMPGIGFAMLVWNDKFVHNL